MAPSRRKGAGKAAAAAAAAACRQWKVGDLVLAKLKGFPAWPATVSEPEKWGYPADWKKVLVYFFGTQQIAFCNPADVEAFTEEKKQSLLTKRHGKGSDFVRAVHEIIDSYEKLKKEDKGINVQSSNEVTLTNTTKSMESLADSVLNGEGPASTVEACPKRSDSNTPGKDPGVFPIKDDGSALQNDASEEPTGNFVVKEAPLPNTYSRKKVGGLQTEKFVIQKRAPSARRSRSSSRVESHRFQNFILPSNNITKSPGNVAAGSLRDGSIRRTKRIRKSPDASEVHDTGSPALVSNSCLEENGSEIVTGDSDTNSLNDGSTVESGYNMMMQLESVECCEEDVELSQRLDFQAKSVVVKKKRKPSRKRASNGVAEVTGRIDKDAGVETEAHKSGEILPNDVEKSNGSYSKEDGDEHLPLVKRARVRMSRPSSSAGEEVDALIKAEVKLSQVSDSCLNCEEEDSPVDGKPAVKGHVGDSSPSNKSPLMNHKKPPLWEVKKQMVSCVDVEAALPPSKRLHRALEAMSANAAAEHGQTSSEAMSTKKMTNGYCSSFTRERSNMSAGNMEASEFGVQNIESLSNNVTQDCTSVFSSNLNPPIVEESAKSPVNLAACNKPVEGDHSSEHVLCEDVPVETVNPANGTSLDTHTAETVIVAESPKPLPSPQLGSQQAHPECSQSLFLPSNDSNTSELRNPCKEDDPSEVPRIRLEPVPGSVEIADESPQNDTSLHLCVAHSNCETTKLSAPPPAENYHDNGMFDVKETKETLKDSNATPSPTTEEVARAAVQGAHLSNSSSSLSDDHLSHHKAVVPGIRSSSSPPTDGLGSTACASPPNTSICVMSTSDNSNLLENSGCCSPDARLHHEKPKHAAANSSNSRGEANAALTSFEANLGTLKRTKESISRATRMAIECAKFGIAPKVVEVIARNLESEPSLHRRVDLFFLVDSITQCSRGLKGDAGGIYPSVIQAKLPRLLLAAAPPGSSALENRRQCLKVLRLWQERRILPESVVRRHIRDLDSLSNPSSAGVFSSRRPLRTERAFDDPLREMEGMVDEYGSNSSFQLPGFRMPPMVKDDRDDDGSDSDGGNFEAVTPEHNSENTEERGWDRTPANATEKRSHILEDVDGELEMEDVAPSCEVEMSSAANVATVNSTLESSHQHQQQHFPPPFAPPLPMDVPPSSPPLPTSPPPPRPPPPSLPLPPVLPDPVTNNLDSRLYVGIHAPPPESRDPPQRPMQMSESANSCSISNIHAGSHQPVRPLNSVQQHQVDGATLHHKAFHLPPPHPAPSNQFSYVQVDQQVQSRSQSYPQQFHFVPPNTETGNFYDHDRMKLAPPHDVSENWRFSAPLSGACYPESSGLPYGHAAYGGPPCEPAPAIPSHSWAFPPPPMNHREPIPHRPTSEGPIPVPVRAPNFWRPR
ncbi:hypothetical protein LguiA_011466 [Lonicera macranthoides]